MAIKRYSLIIDPFHFYNFYQRSVKELHSTNLNSSYITENQRLSPHQNGNRKHHSTETLNIFITDKMLEAMDKKHVTALILLGSKNVSYQIQKHLMFPYVSH